MRRLCNSAFMGGLRVAQGLGCATRETAAVMIVEHLPLTERVGIVKDLDAGVAAAVAAEAGAPVAPFAGPIGRDVLSRRPAPSRRTRRCRRRSSWPRRRKRHWRRIFRPISLLNPWDRAKR